MTTTAHPELDGLDRYKFGWADSDVAGAAARRGLSKEVVRDISAKKGEPDWMLQLRLKGLELFRRKPMPTWGSDLSGIDFENIKYFVRSTEKQAASWDDLPADIKNTYDRLGIPEAEKQRLIAGVAAQYESEVVYHKIREDLEEKGVLFLDTDTALKEQPELFREYFATVIPVGDNKFAALNTAVWSGGCLTADARINVKGKGLVSIADVKEGDEVFGTNLDREVVREKVLAHMESGVKPVYQLRVAGRTLEATGNHKFLVARRMADALGRVRWTAVWVPLDEIEVGEPIAVARHLPDDGEVMVMPQPEEYVKNRSRQRLGFPVLSDVNLCWLLGLWLGDGHTAAPHQHMRQVSFSVPADDPVHGEAIDVVKQVFDAHVTLVKCGFVVSSKAFGTWLDDLGFSGHAKTKRLPEWIYALPHRQQLAILGGLIDADGWIENDGATMSIELANRELLEDVRQLAIGCGLYADGQLTERTRTNIFADGHLSTATCWRLRVQGDLSRVGTRNPAKKGSAASKGRGPRYIASTGLNFSSLATETVGFAVLREKEFVGDKPTYDIQVVGLENFVANGIVAHNSFIYVPKGVRVEIPLQAYFRINTENMGQFERTLIIVDEDAYVHYVEGCTAPIYSSDSLHSAVVEIIVKRGARCRYTTIQNWSNNVYNLVTKRALAQAGATMEWVDGNIGSKVTMKYPAVYLMGEHARGETLSVAFAGSGQHQDAGAKMVHCAPNTSSSIVSKSVARAGGRTSYRGLVQVQEGAAHSRSTVKCDALLVDTISRSDTYPYVDVREDDVEMGHEATVSKISEDQLFYLMSRGMTEDEAMATIVRGFVEPIARELPMEYALELNRLIELQMEGAVG